MFGKSLVVWLMALAPHASGATDPDTRVLLLDTQKVDLDLSSLSALSDYLRVALEQNRGAHAARLNWEASLERAPQVSSLPNPVLSYGHFLQSVETRVGPQERRLGLQQKFPWFGTLGLKGDIALAEAEAAHQRYQNRVQQVIRDVSLAYAEYYYLNSATQITKSNIDLLTGWENILRARYTTGGVTYSDLIKVQVELGKLQDALTTLNEQRTPRMTRLGALLDLPPGTTLPFPETLPDPHSLDDLEVLRSRVLQDNNELQALHAITKSKKLRRDLAGKKSYPSFAVGIDWVHIGERSVVDLEDNGRDALMAKISVELPLWRAPISAAKREATAKHRAAQETLADRQSTLLSRFDDLMFRYRDAERKTQFYRDSLIPKGNQSLQAAFAAFESGDGDFLSVLDAERALLEFGLSLERSRANLVGAQANLNFLVGQTPERGE